MKHIICQQFVCTELKLGIEQKEGKDKQMPATYGARIQF